MFASKIRNLLGLALAACGMALAAGALAQDKMPEVKAKSPIRGLKDPDPQVRLKAALDLDGELDAEAIAVLIDLLAELPGPERRKAELALQEATGEWSPNPSLVRDDEISRRILRDALAGWWRNVDGPTLLAAFRKRTLDPKQTDKGLSLIAELGDEKYATRERTTAELVAMGLPVGSLLGR